MCELEPPPLPIQRCVLRRCCGAEVRLECDVPQILQCQNSEIVCMPQHVGDRHWHLRQQPCHVHERELADLERCSVEREHDRRCVGDENAEVPPVGRVPGQRYDARSLLIEPVPFQVRLDPL